jgi:hypothetical protein
MAPWLIISDDEPGHPQHASLSDRAVRVHLAARCHCARYITDGIIADARQLQRYSAAVVRELVATGLWRHVEGHKYEVVGYLETQRSKADVEAARAKNRERQERFRKRDTNSATNEGVTPLLTPPQAHSHSQAPLRDPKPVSDLQLQQLASSCDEELAEALRAAHELYLEPLQWPRPSAQECRALAGALSNDRKRSNDIVARGVESFWNPQGRGTAPPSVGDLAVNAGKRNKLIAGGFVEPGRRWKCRVCGHAHQPLDFCAPCEHCQKNHPTEFVCDRMQQAKLEAERWAMLTPEQQAEEREAGRYGISRGEMLRMRQRGTWDAWVSRQRAREEATA